MFCMRMNKIGINYDFKALLECNFDSRKSEWSFILTNMSGEKKNDLVGEFTKKIDLNQLIFGVFSQIYSKYLIDILVNKEKSFYWESIINGQMKHSVDIINPITRIISNVTLELKQKTVISSNKCIFFVEMTDIKTTDILPYDLRSVLKSTRNIVNEKNIKIKILDESLSEVLSMCSEIKTVLLPEKIRKTSNIHLDKIYKQMLLIIRKLQLTYPKIVFNLSQSCTGFISPGLNMPLHYLILNIVSNAKNNGATEINIITETDPSNLSKGNIYVKDNGRDNSNFIREQEFLLLYDQIKILGGNINIELSKTGTTFLIEIPILQQDQFILNLSQVQLLNKIDSKTKLVLFVDDVFLSIRILFVQLIKYLNAEYKYTIFPVISSSQWENQGIHIVTFDTYTFVFAAHGLYGLELCLLYRFDLIITDIEMPHLNGIDMITLLIDKKIKSKILINSALDKKELELSEDLIELIKTSQIEFLEKGSKIDFSKILKGPGMLL